MRKGVALDRLSPVDGRYAAGLKPLAAIFSERALIKRRIEIECNWLLALGKLDGAGPAIDSQAARKIKQFSSNSSAAEQVKELEQQTRHDVKAVELYIAKQLQEQGLGELRSWVHFAVTSWDINSLAYALMLNDAHRSIVLPELGKLQGRLNDMANDSAEMAMLARTHGQPASPTTLGKELRIFERRMAGEMDILTGIKFSGKFNGAVGNFNSHQFALPAINWQEVSDSFIAKLGLMPVRHSTQIEPFERLVAYFDTLSRVNRVLLDLARDASAYIALGYLSQANIEGEVGSSTMPHKINPINFENAEGNLQMANGLMRIFADTLQLSRLQRDLSNSTILRNMGVALGHCVVAWSSLQTGLSRVVGDQAVMDAELEANWQVLAEAIQTCLRVAGDEQAYTKLLEVTRGKPKLTEAEYKKIIEEMVKPGELQDRLLALRPQTYIGNAVRLANSTGDGE